MKSKEEVIREAYGEFYDVCSPDKNGWTLTDESKAGYEFLDDKIEYLDFDYFNEWRPKSLKGIENNNGWIIIENKNSLPKKDCRCEFIKYSGEHLYGRFENRMSGLFIDESKRFESPEHRPESISHYKEIHQFSPPLY